MRYCPAVYMIKKEKLLTDLESAYIIVQESA